MSGVGKSLGEISRCSVDDTGRDVRFPSADRLLFEIGGDGAWLVMPTCKGLKESSNSVLRPLISSVSMEIEIFY